MKITKKALFTVINVEITKEEIHKASIELAQAILEEKYPHILSCTGFIQKELLKFANDYAIHGLTMEDTENMLAEFKDVVESQTIEFIARKHGYDVYNYGYWDRKFKIYKAVFKTEGDHI